MWNAAIGSSRINKRWPTAEQAIPKDVLCTSSRREGVSCGSFKGKFASETWEPKIVLHLNLCIGSIGVYHPVFEQQRGNVRGGSWTAGFFENQCGDRRVALIFGSPPEGKVHRKHGNQSESTPQRQTLWNAKTHELTRWYVAGNSPCHWANEAEIRNRLTGRVQGKSKGSRSNSSGQHQIACSLARVVIRLSGIEPTSRRRRSPSTRVFSR